MKSFAPIAASVIAAVSLLLPTPAQAQPFTRLASTTMASITDLRDVTAPALNNNGSAAFTASVSAFATAFVYKVDSQANATQVAAPIAFGPTPQYARVAINDSGRVAFTTTRFLNVFAHVPGVYTATTSALAPTMIDETFDGLGNVNINNSGVVAYDFYSRLGQGSVSAVRRATGPGNIVSVSTGAIFVPQTLNAFGDSVYGAALNNNNAVALLRVPLNFPPSQVERVDAGGTSETFLPNGVLSGVGPAINDSGDILYGVGNTLLLASAPGSFTSIVGAGDGFTAINGWSLNNGGEVAFTGTRNGVQGLFRALAGVAASPVIRVGDSLFDSTVTEVELHRDGLNDRGQLAFRYILANGERGIAITGGSAAAPEPGTLALLGIAGLALLAVRKRRR